MLVPRKSARLVCLLLVIAALFLGPTAALASGEPGLPTPGTPPPPDGLTSTGGDTGTIALQVALDMALTGVV